MRLAVVSYVYKFSLAYNTTAGLRNNHKVPDLISLWQATRMPINKQYCLVEQQTKGTPFQSLWGRKNFTFP